MAKITNVVPNAVAKEELLSNSSLILTYIYGEFDPVTKQALEGIIHQDEALSLFYEDLSSYRRETNASRQHMQQLLDEMFLYKGKFKEFTSLL